MSDRRRILERSPWRRALWALGISVLALSLATAIKVNLGRVAWERANRTVAVLVRWEDVAGSPTSELASSQVTGIAVRASSLLHGNAPFLAEARGLGLEVALLVDRACPAELAGRGPFPLVGVEAALAPDDPLLHRLLEAGSTLVLPEFADLRLERALWDAGYRRVARGHEIPPEDLPALSREEVLARWERAVRERGVRVLLLSPVPGESQEKTMTYCREVTARLREAGYSFGSPSRPPRPEGRPVEVLLHMGVSALLLVVSLLLFRQPALACFLALSHALLPLGLSGIPLRQLDAFLISLLAPVAGALFLLPRLHSGWRFGARTLLLFSLASLAAGVLLAALLADPVFLMKLAEFRGVKASLLLPPLAGTFLYLHSLGWEGVKRSLSSFGRLLGAGLLLVSLLAIAFLLARSGNADPLVSTVEERARGLLEALLVARPRFKEFLLGHPLLFLFGTDESMSLWRGVLLFFGLVGQASILNTFAHGHTPLLFSLLRTGNGIVLGLAAGAALCGALALVRRARRRLLHPVG